jgi:hypothetical protein
MRALLDILIAVLWAVFALLAFLAAGAPTYLVCLISFRTVNDGMPWSILGPLAVIVTLALNIYAVVSIMREP